MAWIAHNNIVVNLKKVKVIQRSHMVETEISGELCVIFFEYPDSREYPMNFDSVEEMDKMFELIKIKLAVDKPE